MDAPLSSADVKFLLNRKREAKFVIAFFYEPRLRYIVIQSGSVKETVNLKIGENIEMLSLFYLYGDTGRTLIDINHHCQVTMNQREN